MNRLAHMVYFALKDNSDAAKEKLLEACRKYLTGHDGTESFHAGVLVGDLNRDVNQRDFDVSLHVIFSSRAAHDEYQQHPRHLQFVDENKDNWRTVRVFDSYVSSGDE